MRTRRLTRAERQMVIGRARSAPVASGLSGRARDGGHSVVHRRAVANGAPSWIPCQSDNLRAYGRGFRQVCEFASRYSGGRFTLIRPGAEGHEDLRRGVRVIYGGSPA